MSLESRGSRRLLVLMLAAVPWLAGWPWLAGPKWTPQRKEAKYVSTAVPFTAFGEDPDLATLARACRRMNPSYQPLPYMLWAASGRLTGNLYRGALLVNLLAHGLTVLLVAWIGGRLQGARVGLASATVMALLPGPSLYARLAQPVTLVALAATAMVAATLWARRDGGWRWAIAGLVMGLAFMVKVTAWTSAWAACLGLWIATDGRLEIRRNRSPRLNRGMAAIVAALVMAWLAGWGLPGSVPPPRPADPGDAPGQVLLVALGLTAMMLLLARLLRLGPGWRRLAPVIGLAGLALLRSAPLSAWLLAAESGRPFEPLWLDSPLGRIDVLAGLLVLPPLLALTWGNGRPRIPRLEPRSPGRAMAWLIAVALPLPLWWTLRFSHGGFIQQEAVTTRLASVGSALGSLLGSVMILLGPALIVALILAWPRPLGESSRIGLLWLVGTLLALGWWLPFDPEPYRSIPAGPGIALLLGGGLAGAARWRRHGAVICLLITALLVQGAALAPRDRDWRPGWVWWSVWPIQTLVIEKLMRPPPPPSSYVLEQIRRLLPFDGRARLVGWDRGLLDEGYLSPWALELHQERLGFESRPIQQLAVDPEGPAAGLLLAADLLVLPAGLSPSSIDPSALEMAVLGTTAWNPRGQALLIDVPGSDDWRSLASSFRGAWPALLPDAVCFEPVLEIEITRLTYRHDLIPVEHHQRVMIHRRIGFDSSPT